jgi:effector-binding domain-containing protein
MQEMKNQRKAKKSMAAKPKLEDRKEQPYAAIRTSVPIPFGSYLPPLWNEVQDWLKSQGMPLPGPAIIRYLTTDMSSKLDIDVGFAVDKPVVGNARIIAGVLPAGQYATLLYTGPYKGKGIFKATVALLEWAKENGITWDTTNQNGVERWNGRVEWYLTDPAREADTKKYRTELAFLVK